MAGSRRRHEHRYTTKPPRVRLASTKREIVQLHVEIEQSRGRVGEGEAVRVVLSRGSGTVPAAVRGTDVWLLTERGKPPWHGEDSVPGAALLRIVVGEATMCQDSPSQNLL